MIFYTCFFLVRILVTVLMFVSKQDNELLTVPLWGATFILCLLIQLIDYKPWESYIDNFTHTYSQCILLIVLLTGTMISAKGTFKSTFKEKEPQAISIMILYTILCLLIALTTTSVNLIIIGRKVFKFFQTRKLKQQQKKMLRPASNESVQNFDILANQGDSQLKEI